MSAHRFHQQPTDVEGANEHGHTQRRASRHDPECGMTPKEAANLFVRVDRDDEKSIRLKAFLEEKHRDVEKCEKYFAEHCDDKYNGVNNYIDACERLYAAQKMVLAKLSSDPPDVEPSPKDDEHAASTLTAESDEDLEALAECYIDCHENLGLWTPLPL